MRSVSRLFLAILAITGAATAQWEPERRVTATTTIPDRTCLGNARAVAMRRDTVHVVYESRSLDGDVIRYARSIDGGATWQFDSIISDTFSDYTKYSPTIALSGQFVHIVWCEYSPYLLYATRVRYRRSQNNGLNWDPRQDVTTVTGFRYRSPSLAVSGANLFVAFDDDYTRPEVYFKRSTDNGSSWAPSGMGLRLDTNALSPSIATNGTTVIVSYSQGSSSNYDLAIRRSTNLGGSWLSRQTIDTRGTATTASCVLMRGTNAYLAYNGNPYGTTDIFFARSTDAGANWTLGPAIDSGPGNQTDPSLNRGQNNVIHVAYTDYSLTGTGINYRNSADEGTVWSLPLRVDAGSGPATRPTVSVNGFDTVAVAWTDGRWSVLNPDVMYRRNGPSLIDVGVTRIVAPAGTIDSTQSVAPACSVANYGTYPATFKVRCRIGGYYSDSAQVTGLLPGTSTLVTFPAWSAWPRGTQAIACSTELAGDMVPSNDRLSAVFSVRVLDAQAVTIIAPTGTVDSGTTVIPRASVRNNGTAAATFSVRISIGAWADSQTVSLAAGASQTVSFAGWTALQRGINAIRCTTRLTDDMVPANNLATGEVTVRVLDVAPLSIIAPVGTVDSGTAVTPRVRVRNNGTHEATFYTRLRIGPTWVDSVQTTLAAGDTQTLAFASWTPTQRGVNAVRCSTKLTGDAVPANNLLTGDVTVRVLDAQAVSILAPTGTVDSGVAITPQAQVRNNGTGDATFYTRLTIGSYVDSQQVTLSPGGTQTLSFAQWIATQRGINAVRCSTRLTGDMVPANNLATGEVTVRVLDVAPLSIIAPVGTVDSGAVITPRVRVRNNGTHNASFNTRLTIGSWADSQSVFLAPGDTQTVSFAGWTALQRGVNTVRCSTRLTGDMVPANNLITDGVTVRVLDAAVSAIVAPAESVAAGAVIPQARLRNLGTTRSPVRAFFAVNSTPAYRDSIILPAGLPDTDTLLNFAIWNATPGVYQVRCSVALAGDMVPANDWLQQSCRVIANAVDFGVTAILAPQGSYDTTADITPRAGLRNFGAAAGNCTAVFRIIASGGAQVYQQPVVITGLQPGRDTVIEFALWPRPHPVGSYAARCSVAAAGDINPTNDTLAGSFVVTGGSIAGWFEKSPLPLTPSGRAVKDGGWLAWDGLTGRLYAAKGNKTGDFYAYRPNGDSWTTLAALPLGNEGKPTGKGAAGCVDTRGRVYAVKGNNTLGFWTYDPATGNWNQLADIPLGSSNKRVKGGADLVYVEQNDTGWVYLLKGYRNEFYRYNTITGSWQPLPDAPVGLRPKWDKGSWLAYDGAGTIYAHKSRYHELWRYDLTRDTWSSGMLASMPLESRLTGRRKRSKDGGSGAWLGGQLFALKGGNTQDFFRYLPSRNEWEELDTMPAFGSSLRRKRVKGGGDLAAADAIAVLFAFKGNKTREFWMYVPGGTAARPAVRAERRAVQAHPLAPNEPLLTVTSPATNSAVLRWSGLPPTAIGWLSVHDPAGRLTLARPVRRSGAVTLTGLAAGVYLVRLEVAGRTVGRKLIIQHPAAGSRR